MDMFIDSANSILEACTSNDLKQLLWDVSDFVNETLQNKLGEGVSEQQEKVLDYLCSAL